QPGATMAKAIKRRQTDENTAEKLAEARLWRKARRGRTAAARRAAQLALFERYQPLAKSTAARVARRRPIAAEDLLSSAQAGLWEAVGRYRPGRGARFATFATARVFGAVMDEVRRQDPAKRLHRCAKSQVCTE